MTGILDYWQHPGRAEQTLGQATLTKWWLLEVYGPLPGRLAESGRFMMEISAYGNRRLWWITVHSREPTA